MSLAGICMPTIHSVFIRPNLFIDVRFLHTHTHTTDMRLPSLLCYIEKYYNGPIERNREPRRILLLLIIQMSIHWIYHTERELQFCPFIENTITSDFVILSIVMTTRHWKTCLLMRIVKQLDKSNKCDFVFEAKNVSMEISNLIVKPDATKNIYLDYTYQVNNPYDRRHLCIWIKFNVTLNRTNNIPLIKFFSNIKIYK